MYTYKMTAATQYLANEVIVTHTYMYFTHINVSGRLVLLFNKLIDIPLWLAGHLPTSERTSDMTERTSYARHLMLSFQYD